MPPWDDGTFVLSFVSLIGAFLALLARAVLKSPCKTCNACGVSCERDIEAQVDTRDIQI